jgi:hypothetical protein
MMDFFNPEDGGISNLRGWMGQIVDESTWLDNTANSDFKHKLHSTKDIAGYGYRYKVRIFGRDTQIKNFPDDQLEIAEVLLPTTSGSGHGGSVQTPNLKQGMYVFGFYKDGIDATEPIIFGVLPNNAQTRLFGGDPDENFIPRSGYFGNRRQIPVATKNIKLEGLGSPPASESIDPNVANVRDADKNIDGTRKFYIPKTINCEGPSGELQGLQRVIKQLLIDVKRAKRFTQSFAGAASNLGSNITNLINEATIFASSLMKSLITKMRGFVVNWVNDQATKLFDLLPPNLRPNAVEGTEKATDTIECVFNKIISKLMKLLKALLLDIIDKYVNAPLCAIESFVGNFLSNILGDLVSGITNAIGGILGPIGDIAGIIFQALDLFVGILNFLSCEEDLDCEILDEWSFFDGSSLSVEQFLGTETSNKIKAFVDEANASAPPCNTAQIPCGPPKISFFGSGIRGASGNPVISATGYIMGVDLLTGGRYTSPPDVRVIDDCGSGGGAVLVPIMNEVDDGEFEVVNVVAVDPGFGYLNSPNGTTGGDGIIFSNPSDSIIINPPSGTSVTAGDIPLTSGGTPVTVGGTGGIPVTAGGTGGIPVTAGGTPVTVGGTGGTPVTAGGTPVTAGGTGGIPVTAGGTGGIPVTAGGTGGTPVTSGGTSLTAGGTGGTPGNGINVYLPDTLVQVFAGQTGYFPAGSTVEIINSDGQVTQTIQGQGQTTPIEIQENGSITTPSDSTASFEENADSYQLLISIDDLAVLNEGVNYSPNDKIQIIPDNGAIVEPIINKFGNITDVNIISGGSGFTDIPDIIVVSETGINAVLVPVFKFERIENLDDISQPTFDDSVINVVDCVGKIAFKR